MQKLDSHTTSSVLIAILLAQPWSSSLTAAGLDADIRATTVRIICSGAVSSSGSGFLIGDTRHVASNQHVVAVAEDDGSCRILSHDGRSIPGEVLWTSERHDLAVLALGTSARGEPARLAGSETVSPGDPIVAAGFPAIADDLVDSSDVAQVSVTRGAISRVVTSREGTAMYQLDAALNPGSSGGPAFNELGQVIGVNTAKAMAIVPVLNPGGDGNQLSVRRLPAGEGIGWAVQIDELLPALDRLNIDYSVDRSPPSYVERLWNRDPLIAMLLLFVSLTSLSSLWLVFSRRGPQAIKNAIQVGRVSTGDKTAPAANAKHPTPILNVLKGPFAGSTLELDEQTLAIGRDARLANLVLPPEETQIGRLHCLVRFDPGTTTFELEDYWSTNGTYLADGTPLAPGQASFIEPGSVFWLANPDIQFRVDIL